MEQTKFVLEKKARYSDKIVTSIDGEAIRAAYDNADPGYVLFVNDKVHCKTDTLYPHKSFLKIEYPFSSGKKLIEVFGKKKSHKNYFQLCINGEYFAGDEFKREPEEDLTFGDKIMLWVTELPFKIEERRAEKIIMRLDKQLAKLENEEQKEECVKNEKAES
jgi:hypothetical protein